MAEHYGSDFITISDEDGQEFELEVLTELEYNGFTYLAVIPAGLEEDGEPILCAVEDEQELEAVNTLIMDRLYDEASED